MNSQALSYNTPAAEWIEGLPVGNGSLGAMIFGEPGNEIITLNHDQLWRNKIDKQINTADIIPEMRHLVLAGKALEAEELFKKKTAGINSRINPYQIFCNLKISLDQVKEYTDYSSILDLEQGLASVFFSSEGIKYLYELFVSRKYNAVFLKIAVDRKNALNCSFMIDRIADSECSWNCGREENNLLFTGEFIEGVSFSAVANLDYASGKLRQNQNKLLIEEATEIGLKIVLETSFSGNEPLPACRKKIRELGPFSYEDIKEQHIKEHGSLFRRVEFNISKPEKEQTTAQLYNDVFSGNVIDNIMYEYLFNMGRYLMISASRPGSMPINLQGIWNDSIAPGWESGYTMDMNMQMQYWMALPCNLAECEHPVFDWITGNKEKMLRRSKEVFGFEGAYIPQYTDFKMTPEIDLPHGSFQVLWPGAAAWMARHFYEYWKYTGDDQFLFDAVFPYLKMCADLFKGILVKDTSGKYISCPSSSPENRTKKGAWLVNTPTMDISLVQELMGNLLSIDAEFKLNDPEVPVWQDIRDNMTSYPIDEEGTLLEWVEDTAVMDPGHRHISHIYGLFPGKLFSPEKTPELYQAAVNAVRKRRENGFGSCATWSHAWYACCFSRMGEGDEALRSIDNIIKSGLIRNFLTTHNDWRDNSLSSRQVTYRLFQIEALLGATAAIAEMFVQSFDEGIKILPSLPKKWPSGEVKGLRAYGGFEIGIRWKHGKLLRTTVFSHNGGRCRLILPEEPGKAMSVKFADGTKCRFSAAEKNIEFTTESDCRYVIEN